MTGLLLAVATAILATFAGLGLARSMPWSRGARSARVDMAFGVALGPMLTGMAMIAVLWLWPGRSPAFRVAAVVGLVGLATALAWLAARRRTDRADVAGRAELGTDPVARAASVMFVGSLLVMWGLAACIPVTQNDALEYAIVGREIHASGDLRTYPVLDPASTRSGFFGPWTHPPLYVALIALAFAIQGGDGDTWLVRLISPWFFAVAALLVAAVGAMRGSPRGGVFAGMLFLAAPLLFLGAASSLIDPLPVLGMALVVALLVGLEASPWQRGAWIGLALGMGLWTHSVAVLFPALLVPAAWLLAQRRVSHRSSGWVPAKEVATMLAVAGLVGAWPYLRNLTLFGNPVSDNPAVFAFPALDWKSYFTVMRGIGTPAEMIQYGLLKGWFAIESYSLVFWLALLGLPLAWREWRRREAGPVGVDGLSRALAAGEPRPVPTLALAAVVCTVYHALVLVSILAGVDVMVRNERYMLVIMPCVALLGAAALDRSSAAIGAWRRGSIVVLAGVIVAQLGAMMAYRGLPAVKAAAAGGGPLDWWAPIGVQREMASLPSTARVLTLKPADMFYSQRRMLSYLDPVMIGFYGLRGPAEAAQWLHRQGVTHVHLPDYWLPPLYNSTLDEVLAAPALADLLIDAGGYQVFRLRLPDGARAPHCGQVVFGSWRRSEELVFGGRKSMVRGDLASSAYAAGESSVGWNTSPLFLRESSTVIRSASAALPRPGREWLIELEVAGEGYVLVYLMTHRAGVENVETSRLLADLPLREGEPGRRLARRVRVPAETASLSISVEHRGRSRLVLKAARAVAVCENPLR